MAQPIFLMEKVCKLCPTSQGKKALLGPRAKDLLLSPPLLMDDRSRLVYCSFPGLVC